MKKTFTKVLSVAIVLALCLPMALAFSATATAARVEADRDQDASGATFIYFDGYKAANKTVTFADKTMTVDGGSYSTLSSYDDGYGIKLTSVGANETIMWFDTTVCSGNLLAAGGRYITMRIKVVNSGLEQMDVRFANNHTGSYQAVHTFDVTGDWQVITYDSAAWGALWNGTAGQRVSFSAIPADAYIVIDYIGLVWGDDYEAKAQAEAEKQAAFHEALATAPIDPTINGATGPLDSAPEADRDTTGFIYFDGVTEAGFTSNGTVNTFGTGSHVAKATSMEYGYGVKITNAGFGGQTMIDFNSTTGVLSDDGTKIAARVKVVNAPAEVMSLTVGQGNNNKASGEFTPTGDWQTVVIDSVWGSLWTGTMIRINFVAEGDHAGMVIYLDWVASSHYYRGEGEFDAVIAAEIEKQEAFYEELAAYNLPDVTPGARTTKGFLFLDGVEGNTFKQYDGTTASIDNNGVYSTAVSATAAGYGVKLTRPSTSNQSQQMLFYTNGVKHNNGYISQSGGDTVVLRVKVENAPTSELGITIRNGQQGVQTSGSFTVTGDWQNVTVSNVGHMNIWPGMQISYNFTTSGNYNDTPDFAVYIDWIAITDSFADIDAFNEAVAAETANSESLLDAIGDGTENGFLGVQQNANNDIRFIAARKEWKAVDKCGFDVVIKDVNGDVIGSNANSSNKESNRAYGSIIAAGEKTLAGDLNYEFNGCYMYTYAIKGVPTEGTYTFEVTPYAIYRGLKQLGNAYVVTVVDGEITSVVAG